MTEHVYTIRSGFDMDYAFNRLSGYDWDEAILCFHEDLLNGYLRAQVLPQLAKLQADSLTADFEEPDRLDISAHSRMAGGMQLTYRMKVESFVFEQGMHAVVFTYKEEADMGVIGFFGGLAKKASKQTYLQMAVKDNDIVQVQSDRIAVDLDQIPEIKSALQREYRGKTLGRDMKMVYIGCVNDCCCFRLLLA